MRWEEHRRRGDDNARRDVTGPISPNGVNMSGRTLRTSVTAARALRQSLNDAALLFGKR